MNIAMPRKICSTEGCPKLSRSGGVCTDHGAKPKICSTKGCNRSAQRAGVCTKHGAKVTICSVKKCPTPARRGGLCAKHGATPKTCSVEGCPTGARKGGLCLYHGGEIPLCKEPGCPKAVQQNGVCDEHGADRPKCIILGCMRIAHKDRLCYKHNQDPVWRAHQRARQNKYERKRYHTDFHYRVTVLLRSRLYQTVSKVHKHSSVMVMVGCDIEDLLQHLQAQFDDEMHWGNFGKWHIDHIKPCASFDLTDPKQQKKCFHYTNLQPLWGQDNLSKGAKLDW